MSALCHARPRAITLGAFRLLESWLDHGARDTPFGDFGPYGQGGPTNQTQGMNGTSDSPERRYLPEPRPRCRTRVSVNPDALGGSDRASRTLTYHPIHRR